MFKGLIELHKSNSEVLITIFYVLITHHNRTKHIDTRYHFIRDCVEDGRVIIEHVKTEDQLADILTKSLGRVKFVELSARIGVKKAWDLKKLKEENVGSEFIPTSRA